MEKQEITIRDEVKATGHGVKYDGRTKAVFNITTGKLYSSIKDAAEDLGISHCNIGMCCRGQRKSAGGYKFCFANNLDGGFGDIMSTIQYDKKILDKYKDVVAEAIAREMQREKEDAERKRLEEKEEKRTQLIERAVAKLVNAQRHKEREEKRYNNAIERCNRAEERLRILTA